MLPGVARGRTGLQQAVPERAGAHRDYEQRAPQGQEDEGDLNLSLLRAFARRPFGLESLPL